MGFNYPQLYTYNLLIAFFFLRISVGFKLPCFINIMKLRIRTKVIDNLKAAFAAQVTIWQDVDIPSYSSLSCVGRKVNNALRKKNQDLQQRLRDNIRDLEIELRFDIRDKVQASHEPHVHSHMNENFNISYLQALKIDLSKTIHSLLF